MSAYPVHIEIRSPDQYLCVEMLNGEEWRGEDLRSFLQHNEKASRIFGQIASEYHNGRRHGQAAEFTWRARVIVEPTEREFFLLEQLQNKLATPEGQVIRLEEILARCIEFTAAHCEEYAIPARVTTLTKIDG